MLQFLGLMVGMAALVAVCYALLRPQWVSILVMLLFPLEQLLQVYLPILSTFNKVVNLTIGVLALLAVILRVSRRDRLTLGFGNRITILTFCFYVLWAVGILYSPARQELEEGFTFTVAYQVLLMGLLPLLILDIFEFRSVLPRLMVAGSIVSLLIVLNPNSSYHSGRLVLDLGTIGGNVMAAGNPLAVAEMGGLIAIVAALYRPERNSQLVTVIRVIAFFTGLWVAIGSGSRGQVLAAALSGIVFFPVSRKLANPKQFVIGLFGFGVLVLGIMLVFKFAIGEQNAARWDPFGMLRDTTGRLDMVWTLLDHYLSSPSHWLFGLGTQAYAAYSPDESTYVHNIAAEALCEHGVVGAAMYVTLFIFTIAAGRKLWMAYKDDPSMRSAVAVLLAICLFFLLQSLKQGSMSYPSPFYWWIILGKMWFHEAKLGVVVPGKAQIDQASERPEAAAAGDLAIEY